MLRAVANKTITKILRWTFYFENFERMSGDTGKDFNEIPKMAQFSVLSEGGSLIFRLRNMKSRVLNQVRSVLKQDLLPKLVLFDLWTCHRFAKKRLVP